MMNPLSPLVITEEKCIRRLKSYQNHRLHLELFFSIFSKVRQVNCVFSVLVAQAFDPI